MTPQSRAATFLFHMLVSCNRLVDMRARVTESEFRNDYRIYELALRYIESLGEAAKRISKVDHTFFDKHGIAVAGQVIGMRNHIAHQYETVDLDLIWGVMTSYAPDLQQAISPVLKRLAPELDLNSLHF